MAWIRDRPSAAEQGRQFGIGQGVVAGELAVEKRYRHQAGLHVVEILLGQRIRVSLPPEDFIVPRLWPAGSLR